MFSTWQAELREKLKQSTNCVCWSEVNVNFCEKPDRCRVNGLPTYRIQLSTDGGRMGVFFWVAFGSVCLCVPTCAGEGETWGANLGEVTESEKGGVYLSGRWAEGKFVFTITGRESSLRFICNLLYMHVHAVGHAWLLGAMKREERRPILVSVNEEERWGGSTELNIHAHDHIRVYGKVNMHL